MTIVKGSAVLRAARMPRLIFWGPVLRLPHKLSLAMLRAKIGRLTPVFRLEGRAFIDLHLADWICFHIFCVC